jgi:hypothetical protein
MMTHDKELVRAALKIVGGDGVQNVRAALAAVRLAKLKPSHRYGPDAVTKRQKNAARTLALALRRLSHILASRDLAWTLRDKIRIDDEGGLERYIKDWIVLADAAVARNLSKPSGYDAAKHEAAKQAARLLMEQGKALIRTRKKSDFCRLAAVLYGQPRADLYRHCSRVKAEIG